MPDDKRYELETPRSLRVFLCHSSGDKPTVRELYQRLCADGIDAWLDEEKLLPGQDWQREIPRAVRASDVVIVCLSRSSITKAGYVQKEIKFALDVADEQPEGTIFLIPAKLEACEVPERLTRWQWVNLYEPKGYERLMKALRARADALGIQLSPQSLASIATSAPWPQTPLTTTEFAELRGKIAQHFNREELRTLCFDLGIEYENLPDTRDGMARELVAYCERRGKTAELIAACQRLRPNLTWDVGATLVIAQPVTPVRTTTKTVPTMRTLDDVVFVFVPRGKFVMGSEDDNRLASDSEKPQHTVEIPYDFWIARFPVTNDQFAAFAKATKYKHELASDWRDKSDHPIVNVSWYDAMEYCKWLNEKLRAEIGDLEIRLPTEAEWEKAARGQYGNEWPWGNKFDKTRCNSEEGGKGGTTPVGAYSPQGDSPYGAADMVGNVWEWCHSIFKPYPYKVDDGQEKESGLDGRVVRGGAWYNSRRNARAACRFGGRPGYRGPDQGVRLVVAPQLS